MSLCQLNWKARNGGADNMDKLASDFTCLKMSALRKVARISVNIDKVTIGRESGVKKDEDDTEKVENIENEQNACNTKTVEKTNASPKYHKASNPNALNFSDSKIYQELEQQRREEVDKKMQCHIQRMNENDRAIQREMKKSYSLMVQEREQRSAQEMARIIAEIDQMAEEEEIKRRHKQLLDAQYIQEYNEKIKRENEEHMRQMKEKEELTKAVMIQHNQFMIKYNNIMALFKNCKNKRVFNVLLATNATRFKESCQQIEAIDEKIRSGNLVVTDLQTIETLVCYMDDLQNLFQTELEKADAQLLNCYESELAQKAQTVNEVHSVIQDNISAEKVSIPQQANEDVTEKEDKSQTISTTTEQEPIATSSIPTTPIISSISDPKPEESPKDSAEYKEDQSYEYIDKESLQIYIKSRQFLAIYKESYKDFLQSAVTKKFRFECQKAINIPVNAISGISEEHLRDKYDRLQNLLSGKSLPNVMQYSHGVAFCKDHLAKKIVNQGETLVSSKPETAFPIAAIIVALWNEHSDFGELFLAHLHEACPFTVPVFLLQQEGQSNEDYYKSLGCKYSEDGTVEKQDKFLKRMSGLMRLYASITVTEQRKGITKTHPHGLQYAWRWLAAVLNIEPRSDTCDLSATLILDMLEVAGNMLWTAYPKQFYKLLTLLIEQHYVRMQNSAGGSGGGPLVRLEEFLNNALAKGTIDPAEGLLPSNFW